MSDDDNKDNDGADWGDALEEQAAGESEASGADWGDALDEQASGEADWGDALSEQATAEAASFDALADTGGLAGISGEVNLDVILDVPVTISMEVGSTRISIRNLLQLNQGSVIELDRLAGEPMDVLVNKTLIARGEVVVVNDKFGLRLTDIISPAERVKKLK
ncbi:MAG: flagellar motor switch protein FliN [Cycloclasticus sp.]|nr:flagellar motor switch protein FliN [Cycloclasticus sp.]MBQ0789775.1 flagellar motor switch protein FliN [Cycloclasticus sp.]